MNELSRNEKIAFGVALLFLMAALVFATWASPVQSPVAQSFGGIGVLDVGTPGLMTSTPAPTATIPPTPTSLASNPGANLGGIRTGYISSYTSGTAEQHQLGTTPKACFLQFISSSAVTVTALTFSSTTFSATTSSTAPMYWICGF